MQRNWRHRIASGTGLAAVIAVILFTTVALDRFVTGWRIDLTERRIHTLSSATRALLQGLERDIELTFYFSASQAQGFPQLRSHARYVEDFLRELAQASDGRIRLSVIDPLPFTDAEDDAAAAGLQAVPLNVPGEMFYFGLEGRRADSERTEVIRFLQPDRERLLEYEVVRLVHTLARDREPSVGIVSGLPVTGGFAPGTGRPLPEWTSISQLRQLFDVRTLDLDGTDTLEAIDVLLLIHPRGLGEATRAAIDQFVLGGGPALVFVDPHAEAAESSGMFPDADAFTDTFADTDTASEAGDLLAAWGLRMIPERVLLDADRALAVSMGQGVPPLRHLAIPGYGTDHFTPDEVVTAQLEQVNFATAGVLEPLPDAATTFTPLIVSSRNTALVPTEQVRFLTDPRQLARGFVADDARHVVAARVTGPARSARANDDAGGDIALGEHAQGDIQVMVVADTDVLSDALWVTQQSFFGRTIPVPWASNGDLLINAIDQLAGGSQLISLRGRAGFQRPFTRVEMLQRRAEARFLETEQELERRLRDTEERLAELERQRLDAGVDTLTVEQMEALQAFQHEQLRIRRELREVQRQLTEDIDRLGRRLQLLNILAVPLLLVLVATLLALHRRRRRQLGLRLSDLES